jgi:chromosome segregation ATPase
MVGTLAIYEQQIANLKMQLGEMNARLLQLQEQQTSLQSELEPYKAETKTLSRSTTDLTKALAELKERVVLRAQLAELKDDGIFLQEKKTFSSRIELNCNLVLTSHFSHLRN